MVKEAEKHAEEDKQRKEKVELRNQTDTLVYTTEKSLKDYGDKVSEEEKKKINEALDKVREALKGDDLEAMKKTSEELTQASHKLAETMYRQASKGQAGPQAGPQAEAGKPQEAPQEEAGKKGQEEDIIDAEYKVEDEEKKK